MKSFYKIKRFSSNSKIVHIGGLFRKKSSQCWYINLWFHPIQEKKNVSFSQMPMLARGKVVNQTKRIDRQTVVGEVTFTGNTPFEEVKLSECPSLKWQPESIRNVEGKEWGFKFKQQDGVTVYLPQLELARVLFLTSSYLSRAALSTVDIVNDFDINFDMRADKAVINVMKTTSFPVRAFSYTSVRHMLAWILLDPNARESFTSIAKSLHREIEQKGAWLSWAFHFIPPNLTGWKIRYKGSMDYASKSLFVHEIIALDILPSMPTLVEFRHPAFKDYKVIGKLEGEAKEGAYQQRPDDLVIDDDASASSSSEAICIRNDVLKIRFKKPFQTLKRTSKKGVVSGKGKEVGEDKVSGVVSTGEPEQEGEFQAADFSGGKNETDYTQLCEGRFSGFFHMLELLESKHECKIINKQINELPASARSKKHLLKTGEQRMICCATVTSNNKCFKLLEIDTSDGIQMLSTKVIQVFDEKVWRENYSILKGRIISSSLSWPTGFLDEVFGKENHIGVTHPSNKNSGIGNIPSEAIPSWAQRVQKKLI
jgi:hypothetical protein